MPRDGGASVVQVDAADRAGRQTFRPTLGPFRSRCIQRTEWAMSKRIMIAICSIFLAVVAAAAPDARSSADEGAGMRTDEARAIGLMSDFAERT